MAQTYQCIPVHGLGAALVAITAVGYFPDFTPDSLSLSPSPPITTNTMENRICDVPIDLDEENCGDISRDFIERAISTAISLKHDKSAWSSSSGSYYDDDEPTTSPIDLGGKWYWNSPVGSPSNSTRSRSDTIDTHDSGYLSRSNSLGKGNERVAGHRKDTASPRPLNQVYLLPIPNCDSYGPQEVMAKRLQSNREIDLLQHLDSRALRLDPWNPSPPLISIVNGDDYQTDDPLAIFDPLVAYDSQPLETVEEALDFLMQLLQGLVFLRDHRIVHGDIHGGVIMMDKGHGHGIDGTRLNRIQCNIRYHLVDFTHATIVGEQDDHMFLEDLRDLGLLVDKAFGTNLPELSDMILEMTTLPKGSLAVNSLTNASRLLGDLEDTIAAMPAQRIKARLE